MKEKHYHYLCGFFSETVPGAALIYMPDEKITKKFIEEMNIIISNKYRINNVVIFSVQRLECDCDE